MKKENQILLIKLLSYLPKVKWVQLKKRLEKILLIKVYLKENMLSDAQKIISMTDFLCENLQKIQGVKLYSKPNPFGIVTLNFINNQSEFAAYTLSEEYGICVRGGLHCAPLMHKALSSDGLIRVSLSAFNTLNECQAFLDAAARMCGN